MIRPTPTPFSSPPSPTRFVISRPCGVFHRRTGIRILVKVFFTNFPRRRRSRRRPPGLVNPETSQSQPLGLMLVTLKRGDQDRVATIKLAHCVGVAAHTLGRSILLYPLDKLSTGLSVPAESRKRALALATMAMHRLAGLERMRRRRPAHKARMPIMGVAGRRRPLVLHRIALVKSLIPAASVIVALARVVVAAAQDHKAMEALDQRRPAAQPERLTALLAALVRRSLWRLATSQGRAAVASRLAAAPRAAMAKFDTRSTSVLHVS